MIVLRGAEVELLGEMAALPPDLSPFQIGTRGQWNGRGFEIIGRIRIEWEEGSWNEWCLLYDGETTGWLAEAQGQLMLSFPRAVPEKISAQPGDYEPGLRLALDGRPYTVVDLKTAIYLGSEGELPFPAPARLRRPGVDLIGHHGGFGAIEIVDDEAEVFLGEYVEFETLRLSNLRPVPGWSAEIAQEKNRTTALSCPVCGAVVELHAAGQTMSVICGSCGSVLDTATAEVQLIERAETVVQKIAPVLPIGQRGKLFGTEYEIIGLVQRADQWVAWSEYLLFNPWRGFRWLVFFQGHWSLVNRFAAVLEPNGNRIKRHGRTHKLFAAAQAKVTNVLGEFYWKVRRGEEAFVSDYIAPPFILSREAYAGEVAWSEGEYVEREVVRAAFNLDKLPRPEGIYLNQPNPWKKRWQGVRFVFLLAFCALCFIQCSSLALRPEAEVMKASFVFERPPLLARALAYPAAEPARTLSTPRFTLAGGEQRVTVVAQAPVNNNWLGLELELVNAKSNASRPAVIEVSAYHGVDSDGAWSEGSQTARTAFAGVPRGEYFLTIEPSADQSVPRMPFTISVRAGGIFNSNFVLMLIFILAYPAFLLWRRHAFEARRWAESDYSP